MKGIVLAGGLGTRLYPLTLSVSKQLLPVADKPMIFYSLSTLMLSGIKEILLVTNPEYIDSYKRLLGDGRQLGISINYLAQHEPRGIADVFLLGEEFINNSPVCLVLGDNIFYGDSLPAMCRKHAALTKGAVIFGYRVVDPERYGVAEIDSNYNVLSLEEKPSRPKSNLAVTGLYYYDDKVVEIAKGLQPSARGELEITDVNKEYLARGELKLEPMGRGMAWLDTGTSQSISDASQFIEVVEARQGLKVACLEEIAHRNGWMSNTDFAAHAEKAPKSSYGEYLRKYAQELA